MKTRFFQNPRFTLVAFTALALVGGNALAQDSSASTAGNTPQPAATPTAAQLPYGVSGVLQLSRAKVGDSTIISYIRNSGNDYGLNAAQIIYLRRQGVSSAVINAMLNQHSQTAQPVPTAAAATSPPASSAQTAAVVTQPSVAYVQSVPSSSVYIIPDTQTYNYDNWYYSQPPYGYYPYYGYYWSYPGVSVSFGWGRGWGWDGHWRGYHSGWYRGGWHHR